MEQRLGASQTTLEECKLRISDIQLELGVFIGSASEENAKNLNHFKERLCETLDYCEENDPENGIFFAAHSRGELRTCAEKLSVEAVVLKEMAKLCRKDSAYGNPVICDGERHLIAMQQASQSITRIQHKVAQYRAGEGTMACYQNQFPNSLQLKNINTRETLKEYSSLLAQKLMFQAQMSVMLTEVSRRQNQVENIEDDDSETGE